MRFRFPGVESADASTDEAWSSPFAAGIVAVSPPSSLLIVRESRRSGRHFDADGGRGERNTRLENRRKLNPRHSPAPTKGERRRSRRVSRKMGLVRPAVLFSGAAMLSRRLESASQCGDARFATRDWSYSMNLHAQRHSRGKHGTTVQRTGTRGGNGKEQGQIDLEKACGRGRLLRRAKREGGRSTLARCGRNAGREGHRSRDPPVRVRRLLRPSVRQRDLS